MRDTYLGIGNYVINLDAIAHVHKNRDGVIEIIFLSTNNEDQGLIIHPDDESYEIMCTTFFGEESIFMMLAKERHR